MCIDFKKKKIMDLYCEIWGEKDLRSLFGWVSVFYEFSVNVTCLLFFYFCVELFDNSSLEGIGVFVLFYSLGRYSLLWYWRYGGRCGGS